MRLTQTPRLFPLLVLVLVVVCGIGVHIPVPALARPQKRLHVDHDVQRQGQQAPGPGPGASAVTCSDIAAWAADESTGVTRISEIVGSSIHSNLCGTCLSYARALFVSGISTSIGHRAQLRLLNASTECLSKSAANGPPEAIMLLFKALTQKAKMYYALKQYHEAKTDVHRALDVAYGVQSDRVGINPKMIGFCHFLFGKAAFNTGDIPEALDHLRISVEMGIGTGMSESESGGEPEQLLGDAWFWLGATSSLMGRDEEEPERAFAEALALKLKQKQTGSGGSGTGPLLVCEYWGENLIGAGRHRRALEAMEHCATPNCRRLRGIAFQSLGRFREALDSYGQEYQYLREWTLYQVKHIGADRSLEDVFLKASAEFPSQLKNAWSHKKDASEFTAHFLHLDSTSTDVGGLGPGPLVDFNTNITIDNHEADPTWRLADRLFKFGERFMRGYQLDCDGFKRNHRQLRAMSLAVIDFHQQLKRGLIPRGDYRRAFNVLAKWRAISAPHEPVFWSVESVLSNPTRSRTQITRSGSKVLRYYRFYDRVLEKIKDILSRSRHKFGKDKHIDVKKLATLGEICDWVGHDDFYVTSKVITTRLPRTVYEGTAFIWEKRADLGILSMHSSERWKRYDEEMKRLWTEKLMKGDGDGDVNVNINDVLHMLHLWFNFMPLSRGTAGLGVAMMQALFLSHGNGLVLSRMPPGLQIDWEALLIEDPHDFAAAMRGVLPVLTVSAEVAKELDELPLISEAFPNARVAIAALNRIAQ